MNKYVCVCVCTGAVEAVSVEALFAQAAVGAHGVHAVCAGAAQVRPIGTLVQICNSSD